MTQHPLWSIEKTKSHQELRVVYTTSQNRSVKQVAIITSDPSACKTNSSGVRTRIIYCTFLMEISSFQCGQQRLPTWCEGSVPSSCELAVSARGWAVQHIQRTRTMSCFIFLNWQKGNNFYWFPHLCCRSFMVRFNAFNLLNKKTTVRFIIQRIWVP